MCRNALALPVAKWRASAPSCGSCVQSKGVEIDATGKLAGRGAYLHPYQNCWQAVLRGGRIEQALRTRLNEENRQLLLTFMATLPESEAADNGATIAGTEISAALEVTPNAGS